MNEKLHTMFRALLAAILVFVFHASLYSQSGWYPLQSGTSNILKSVYFINSNTGYMSGDGIILKTVNGGNNWMVVTTLFGGSSIHFVNEMTGYVCDGTIYKTIDGGVGWQQFNLTSLKSLYFIDAYTGFAVGTNSQILRTYDGGQYWQPMFVSLFYCNFTSVVFTDTRTGFIAGGKMFEPYTGIIYKTTNCGETWVLLNPDAPDVLFNGIDFPTPYLGFAVGGDSYGSSGVIYKTTNYGEAWVQQGIVNRDLLDVHFANYLTGYCVGENGKIFKTTDGSVIWNSQTSNTSGDINSVFFVNGELGYIAGASGSVQKTVNGGVSGPPFAVVGKVLYPGGQAVTNGYVKALKYNPNSDIIEVIDSAAIQPNGDYLLPNLPPDSVDIMAFPDDEDNLVPGFVPTYYTGNSSGTIYWTSSKTLFTNQNIFGCDIRVINRVGASGVRMISGGVYTAPTGNNNSAPLKDAFVYALVGYDFSGYGGSLTGGQYSVNNLPSASYRLICDRMGYRSAERYENLGGVNLDSINFYLTNINVIGIQPNGTGIPSTFRLEQNYPNPFNPSTNIKIDVPKSSSVRVIVYDMLGRELETLVNENLTAGSYKLTWNASKYSSGIYFYRIISGDFTDTKKMILVK